MLPNLALACLVLVLGFFLARILKNTARRYLLRSVKHHTLNRLFASFVHLFILGVTIFIALRILQLDDAVTSLLAGAGIVGIALAFAFQDIAANFMSGIFILLRRPVRIGDIISTKDHMGSVEEINLRDTVLKTFQGQMVIIPNKDILQNPIANFSLLGKRRMDLEVGISYGDDLEKVKTITLEAVKNISGRTEDEVTLFFSSFGDSSINFEIRIWINSPDQPAFLRARSEAIICIKRAYDAQGITIPFPIRTLDFGIKGGEKLNEMELHVSSQGSAAGS